MKSGEVLPAELEIAPDEWVPGAARHPIGFAQVREDAALDQWVIEQLGSAEVLMVASGGCTAAALAGGSTNVSRLHLVDPNPAQLALARLKLRLLATHDPVERLSLLGHGPMSPAERGRRLAAVLEALNLPLDVLGPVEMIANAGPDHAGRYEILFSKLRTALGAVSDELTALLQLDDPNEQAKRVHPETQLGRALDAAFDSVMALPNLIGLFGAAATRNRREPFSRHFARRARHVLSTLPAANNPYLWQMLLGRFPAGVAYPWLSAPAPQRMPEIRVSCTTMVDALQEEKDRYEFVHLSNILDWLSPDDAHTTLELAWKALRPGGLTLIRQLNSRLDIRSLGERFEWLAAPAEALHRRDRSFFYRGLFLGRKK
jgi:S-adenosylmethionine-diacylglycerol 3-amino-3-carboxypropyl transferase